MNLLFYGMGSEYVLSPLATLMEQEGHHVVEVDVSRELDPWSKILRTAESVIFVTSAHLTMNESSYLAQYHAERSIPSPLTILDRIKPRRSIYVPHDLAEPILDGELPWLRYFDAFLAPRPGLDYLRAYCPVVECGWVRKNSSIAPIPQAKAGELKVAWAFSEFGYHQRLGVAETVRRWQEVLNRRPTTKFPQWPGTEELERAFQHCGAKMLPSQGSVDNLIRDHHVVITNGLSSVTLEAHLAGRMVINVIDGSHPAADHQRLFGALPGLRIVDLESAANVLDALHEGNESIRCGVEELPQFDANLAIRTILGS